MEIKQTTPRRTPPQTEDNNNNAYFCTSCLSKHLPSICEPFKPKPFIIFFLIKINKKSAKFKIGEIIKVPGPQIKAPAK